MTPRQTPSPGKTLTRLELDAFMAGARVVVNRTGWPIGPDYDAWVEDEFYGYLSRRHNCPDCYRMAAGAVCPSCGRMK